MSYENIFQSFQGLYVSKKKWVLIVIIWKTPPPKKRKKKNFPYLPASRTSSLFLPQARLWHTQWFVCFLCRPGQGQGMLILMCGKWEGNSWVGLKEKLELLVAWMLILTVPSITQNWCHPCICYSPDLSSHRLLVLVPIDFLVRHLNNLFN